MNIAVIGLPEDLPGKEHELHRFLGGMLSNDLSLEKKKEILKEYKMERDKVMEEEVENMCNLSQDIIEKGMAKGMAKGMEQGMEQGMAKGIAKEKQKTIIRLLQAGRDMETISLATGLSKAEIQKVLAELTQ